MECQLYFKHGCKILFIDCYCEIKWDRVLITDPHILASRPDKPNKILEFIDVAAL